MVTDSGSLADRWPAARLGRRSLNPPVSTGMALGSVLALQREAGNAAVVKMLRVNSRPSGSFVAPVQRVDDADRLQPAPSPQPAQAADQPALDPQQATVPVPVPPAPGDPVDPGRAPALPPATALAAPGHGVSPPHAAPVPHPPIASGPKRALRPYAHFRLQLDKQYLGEELDDAEARKRFKRLPRRHAAAAQTSHQQAIAAAIREQATLRKKLDDLGDQLLYRSQEYHATLVALSECRAEELLLTHRLKALELTADPSVLKKYTVKYLTSKKERRAYELTGGASLEQGNPPKPFDTSSMYSYGMGGGFAAYVMSPSGRLYAAEHRIQRFHHSSFLMGGDVASAGELKVSSGTLKAITNKSGHYKGTDKNLAATLDRLEARGVDLSSVEIHHFRGGSFEKYTGNAYVFLHKQQLAPTSQRKVMDKQGKEHVITVALSPFIVDVDGDNFEIRLNATLRHLERAKSKDRLDLLRLVAESIMRLRARRRDRKSVTQLDVDGLLAALAPYLKAHGCSHGRATKAYTFAIAVSAPQPHLDRHYFVERIGGHAWLEWEDETGLIDSIGFFPSERRDKPTRHWVQGTLLRPDPVAGAAMERRSTIIDDLDLQKLDQFNATKERADYHFLKYNCTSYAREAWTKVTKQDPPNSGRFIMNPVDLRSNLAKERTDS